MIERIAGTPFAPKFMGDLAHIDSHGHSHRSLTWWGMMAMIAVEGTVFALACAAYLYLSNQSPQWPPHKLSPDLLWGTAFTILTVLSFLPNMWMNRVAEKEELKPLQLGLIVMSVIGLALVGIRVTEFACLNVAWSDSAYGSIVVTLGLAHRSFGHGSVRYSGTYRAYVHAPREGAQVRGLRGERHLLELRGFRLVADLRAALLGASRVVTWSSNAKRSRRDCASPNGRDSISAPSRRWRISRSSRLSYTRSAPY